ncbi:MAG: hypothetical protein PHG58_11765, partial [Clostridia bacterium]|nr:hypothetical protein [Clostridia bacterium]
ITLGRATTPLAIRRLDSLGFSVICARIAILLLLTVAFHRVLFFWIMTNKIIITLKQMKNTNPL